MHIKGIEPFRENVPWLAGRKIVLLPFFFLLVMAASILFMVLFNSLPEMVSMGGRGSPAPALLPLAGYIAAALGGFVMVYQFWVRRDRLKAGYGERAYRRIVPIGFAGIVVVMSLAVHVYIPYWRLSPLFWADSPLRFLVVPLDSYAGTAAPVLLALRIAIAAFCMVAGLLTVVRSVQTFGFDYMALVYLYYPEKSEIQEHRIYSVLRHPAYGGILTIALGGLFFLFTPYSILFFLVFLIAFSIHIRFVEEKELIARFGESYRDYMKKVPAFFIRPRQAGAMLRFLLGGR